jgi:hypothetical protein
VREIVREELRVWWTSIHGQELEGWWLRAYEGDKGSIPAKIIASVSCKRTRGGRKHG